MQKKVTVSIDPLGNASVEAHNFNGIGCAEATKNIEKALAGNKLEGVKREYKPEWAKNGSCNTVSQTR